MIRADAPAGPAQAAPSQPALQAVAASFNQSETAFLLPLVGDALALRWFTPSWEVPPCGYATPAVAQGHWGRRSRGTGSPGPGADGGPGGAPVRGPAARRSRAWGRLPAAFFCARPGHGGRSGDGLGPCPGGPLVVRPAGAPAVVGWQCSQRRGGMHCEAPAPGLVRLTGTGHLLWDGRVDAGNGVAGGSW